MNPGARPHGGGDPARPASGATQAAARPAGPPVTLGQHPLLRAFLATRPAFLSITGVGVLLGWAAALHARAVFDPLTALATLLFALAAHAGANVINDFHDTDTDALNTERLYPYTGGSRFIQDGVMSRAAIGTLGYGLLAAVVGAGLWLVGRAGTGLLLIGVLGIFVGWAYSAPPLRLAARGLGEVCIAAGWMLLVAGSDYVQRGSYAQAPVLAGLAYGLMVANLLYINQFPDFAADRAAGKLTVVARLGRRRAVGGYALLAGLAALVLAGSVAGRVLPVWALAALLALVPAARAWRELQLHFLEPQQLRGAIVATIMATHVFGLLLACTLALA